MDIVEIQTALIDEDTDQPRNQFDETSLQELMNSIAELGLLSPIKVRKANNGRYKIIYGNRRYKACLALNLQTIPCIVSSATDKLDIYLEQIAENLTREGFSPLEEAEAFDKVLTDPKFSSSIKFLSSKLGKPETYIKNKCDLLKFGNAVKKLIVSGTEIRQDKLTEDQLAPIKDLPAEYRDSLALIIAKDALPVSDVKKIARLFKDPNISAGTKGKLLFKTGRDLLETWSTFELNKAERAKTSEPKAVKKNKSANVEADQVEQVAASQAQTEHAHAGQAGATQVQTELPMAAILESSATTLLEDKLQQLLAALLSSSLTPELIRSYETLEPNSKENFKLNLNALITSLERHLAEWSRMKQFTTTKF